MSSDPLLAWAQTVASAVTSEEAGAPEGRVSPSSTIRPSERASLGSRRPSGSGIALGEMLGVGGMGVVREGWQRALDRTVAVKTIRDELRAHLDAVHGLLREARVTGSLEHPNVVPVHDVTLDENGAPMIVLKKISGVAWSELLADVERLRPLLDSGDPLEWHLRTLMQIATVVHFGHTRRVVHRDLKPANVMIGEHGEVYLLDWGIALELDEGAETVAPSGVASLSTPVGTPVYMAPEMLGAEGAAAIGPRTDVYLLGAILFEILAGRPPHTGSRLVEVFANILMTDPELPPDAPEELALICRRAMAREPADRFESAEAFRRALASFLERRSATELALETERRIDALLARLAASRPGVDDTVALYDLYGACRFGMRQALRASPDLRRAREGLRRATEAMARYELRERNVRAAEVLLAEIEDADPSLVREVAALRDEQARHDDEVERLRAIARDVDPRVGQRRRVAVALTLGTLWIFGPLALGAVQAWAPEVFRTHATVLGGSIGVGLLVAAIWRFRKSAIDSPVNRRFAIAIGWALALQSLAFALDWAAGIDVAVSESRLPLIWGAVLGMVAVGVERRLWPAAIFQLGCHTVASLWLESRFLAMGIAMAATTANFLLIWNVTPADAEPEARERATIAPE